MLNINQNFDLKAPVFNFDRDYFNSVEELNAYDTSNVPDHFVTNVAGMLYLFTDGAWIPMIGTVNSAEDDRMYFTNIGSNDINIFTSSDSTHVCNGLMLSHPNSGKGVSLTVDNSGPEVFLQGSDTGNRANIKISDDSPSLELAKDGIAILSVSPTGIIATSDWTDSTASSIKILTNKILTLEEQRHGYSPVDMSLTDGDYSTNINAKRGFMHKTEDGFTSYLDGEELNMRSQIKRCSINSQGLYVCDENNEEVIYLSSFEENSLALGSDKKFKISRPADNTEGATITGVKSIAAFANPSATKVWATDGSTVDLTTKANTSDVLLKKSASGGYYIEENSNKIGWAAFAANLLCTANGNLSFAEGCITKASGSTSHAEGYSTTASGNSSHAEGYSTTASGHSSHAEGYHIVASGSYSHAEGFATLSNGESSHSEGNNTKASGYCSHALGTHNVDDKNAIHSVGIGNDTTRKNAEYIYAKNNTDGTLLVDDPKNGYKYLIGVGGYDGISTDNTTYKSVQEVIADLTARIEQLETLVANCVSISNVDEQTN